MHLPFSMKLPFYTLCNMDTYIRENNKNKMRNNNNNTQSNSNNIKKIPKRNYEENRQNRNKIKKNK